MDKLTYACELCGQELAARVEHVGRRARCKACNHVQAIPDYHDGGNGRLESPPPLSYRAEAYHPAPSPPSPRYDDNRADAEHAPPRSGRARRPNPPPRAKARRPILRRRIVVPMLVVLLLTGIALGAWWWLAGGAAEDLALVPSDATAFVSLRPADLLSGYWARRMRKDVDADDYDNALEEMTKFLGAGTAVDVESIERVTLVFDRPVDTEWGEEPLFVIVRTTKAFDPEDLLKKYETSNNDGEECESVDHKGRTLFVTRRDFVGNSQAIYFHSATIFVHGSEDGVKRGIDAALAEDDEGPLQEAKRVASSSSRHCTVAYNAKNKSDLSKVFRKGAFPRAVRKPAERILQLESEDLSHGYVTIDAESDVSIRLVHTMKSNEAAKELVAEVKDLLERARKALEDDKDVPRKIRKGLSKTLRNVDAGSSGETVTIEMEIDRDLINDVLDEMEDAVGRRRR